MSHTDSAVERLQGDLIATNDAVEMMPQDDVSHASKRVSDDVLDSTAPNTDVYADNAEENKHAYEPADKNVGHSSPAWGRLQSKADNGFLNSAATAVASLAAGVFLWFLASKFNINWYINFENVPGPGKVFMAFVGHLQTEVFYTHIGVSLRRIFISYSLAVLMGVVIGVLMGRSVLVKRFVMPYIEVIRPIPAVAWIPLAILMWPTEESSIIYITFLGALFPIVLNTLHGVEQTPEVLVRAARSLGASRWGIFRHVVLPGAMPSIAAGLAIGMGVSWFSLLAGEIISGQYGIGYFTWDAYSLINYQDIVVGMLVIGFLGTASTAIIKLITKPMLRWQQKTR